MCTENHVCFGRIHGSQLKVRTYVHVYVRTYNVMSQLSDWKRAHMCTENHVCFGRIHAVHVYHGRKSSSSSSAEAATAVWHIVRSGSATLAL